MNTKTRIAVERQIVRKLVKDALAAGYLLSVDDGGDDFAVTRSNDFTTVMQALFNTDMDYLVLHSLKADGGRHMQSGTVQLVYGNDGYDVIADYSVRLEDVLRETHALAQRLEQRHG